MQLFDMERVHSHNGTDNQTPTNYLENVGKKYIDEGGKGVPPTVIQTAIYFFSAFKISRAAFAPDPPVRPVPGCVPLPQR